MPIVLKSGSPRPVEFSGPFQDRTGIALPFLELMFRPFPGESHIPLSSRFIFHNLFRYSWSFHPLYVTCTYVCLVINFTCTYLLFRGFVLSLFVSCYTSKTSFYLLEVYFFCLLHYLIFTFIQQTWHWRDFVGLLTLYPSLLSFLFYSIFSCIVKRLCFLCSLLW